MMFVAFDVSQCCNWGIANFKSSCDVADAPCNINQGAAAAAVPAPAPQTGSVKRYTVVGIWQGANVNYWSKCAQLNAYTMNALMYQDVRSLSFAYAKSYLDQGINLQLVLEFWDSPWNLLWNLAGGSRDNELRQFFQQVAKDGRPLTVRILHEMNGNWYPWCIYAWNSNNSIDAYKKAFWHISGLIKSIAPNVKIQQAYNSMNVGGGDSFASMYVGDASVDEITVSAYNFCGAHNNQIQAIDQLISPWYNAMTAITGKPLGISEMSTTGQCGINKAAWILDTFAKLAYNFPRIQTVLFFLENKGNEDLDVNDWSQQQAFGTGWRNFKNACGWSGDETAPTVTADDAKSLSDADAAYQEELQLQGFIAPDVVKNTPVPDDIGTAAPIHLEITP